MPLSGFRDDIDPPAGVDPSVSTPAGPATPAPEPGTKSFFRKAYDRFRPSRNASDPDAIHDTTTTTDATEPPSRRPPVSYMVVFLLVVGIAVIFLLIRGLPWLISKLSELHGFLYYDVFGGNSPRGVFGGSGWILATIFGGLALIALIWVIKRALAYNKAAKASGTRSVGGLLRSILKPLLFLLVMVFLLLSLRAPSLNDIEPGSTGNQIPSRSQLDGVIASYIDGGEGTSIKVPESKTPISIAEFCERKTNLRPTDIGGLEGCANYTGQSSSTFVLSTQEQLSVFAVICGIEHTSGSSEEIQECIDRRFGASTQG